MHHNILKYSRLKLADFYLKPAVSNPKKDVSPTAANALNTNTPIPKSRQMLQTL